MAGLVLPKVKRDLLCFGHIQDEAIDPAPSPQLLQASPHTCGQFRLIKSPTNYVWTVGGNWGVHHRFQSLTGLKKDFNGKITKNYWIMESLLSELRHNFKADINSCGENIHRS